MQVNPQLSGTDKVLLMRLPRSPLIQLLDLFGPALVNVVSPRSTNHLRRTYLLNAEASLQFRMDFTTQCTPPQAIVLVPATWWPVLREVTWCHFYIDANELAKAPSDATQTAYLTFLAGDECDQLCALGVLAKASRLQLIASHEKALLTPTLDKANQATTKAVLTYMSEGKLLPVIASDSKPWENITQENDDLD